MAAAKSNVAAEMFRAITRAVLFDHTAALSSMNRVDDTSDAAARSPARAPLTVTSSREDAPGARLGRSQDVNIRGVRCRIEKVFGTCKRGYGLRRMHWLGLAKAGLQVRLAAMAYNLCRSLGLLMAKAA